MALGKAEIRGHRTLIDELTTPRPITRMALWAFSAALAQVLWVKLDLSLLAAAGTMAFSFCILCSSAVWAMRDKADAALLGDALSVEEFRNAHRVATQLRRRSTWRAAVGGLWALVAAGPAITAQLAGAAWQWMVIAGGIGVAEAAYSFLIANAWDEELRAKRASDIEKTKLKQARIDELERLSRSTDLPGSHDDSGWTTVSRSLHIHKKLH